MYERTRTTCVVKIHIVIDTGVYEVIQTTIH